MVSKFLTFFLSSSSPFEFTPGPSSNIQVNSEQQHDGSVSSLERPGPPSGWATFFQNRAETSSRIINTNQTDTSVSDTSSSDRHAVEAMALVLI